MGIGVELLTFLTRLKTDGYFPVPKPRVMEIGAQQLSNSFLRAEAEIDVVGRLFDVSSPLELPKPTASRIIHGEMEHLESSAPAAREFWTWLGFEYAAIDVDESPGSIPLDLNVDSVPMDTRETFHLVTNFGTTEHVANQLNAFKVIHDLTAVGGIMIHNLPSQGMVNHGLVNYNPKFIWYLARSNNYKVIYMNFLGSNVRYPLPESIVNDMKRYTPDVAQNYLLADAGIHVILQKTSALSFVPPLDVTSGAKTTFPELQRRYWTVFGAASSGSEVKAEPPDAIRALQDMNRELQNANRKLQAANEELQMHLDAIRSSASWRVTAPLRVLGRRLRIARWSRLSR